MKRLEKGTHGEWLGTCRMRLAINTVINSVDLICPQGRACTTSLIGKNRAISGAFVMGTAGLEPATSRV
jgi:hypothetical protein